MEKELGISYPTVRSKLDGVIKKLGYETGADEQAAKREEILKALENGEITAEQALAQLKWKRRFYNGWKIENIENEEAKNATIDVTAFPKYQETLKEVNELQEIVDKLINGDTSEIQGRKNNIIDLINNIDKQLNERAIQERTKERIKELENEEENIANKVQELEAQQYQIEQFTKTKVELLESAINSKFEVVKFRLFDTQINGGLVECCDTLVKGVPYSDVNNAHKILAGLDIINTLIKFYQTSAPIFIDNRESINELYNINAQIISLIVTTDSQLRIEVI